MNKERTNADRATSAAISLAVYNAGDSDDRVTTIGDLIADLLHLIAAETNDDDQELAGFICDRALRHFEEEIREEALADAEA